MIKSIYLTKKECEVLEKIASEMNMSVSYVVAYSLRRTFPVNFHDLEQRRPYRLWEVKQSKGAKS